MGTTSLGCSTCSAQSDLRQRAELAAKLVKPGGSGTDADAALVARELQRFPVDALERLLAAGTRVVACRGSVTDYLVQLKSVQPRGWKAGSTWDRVPGLFFPSTNEVVVATTGHGTWKGPHVPVEGEGHGSKNVVLHEAAHALDYRSAQPLSSTPAFEAARTADARTLSDYELQPGAAGREETFAESAARYYAPDARDARAHPNLHAYWDSDPLNDAPRAR